MLKIRKAKKQDLKRLEEFFDVLDEKSNMFFNRTGKSRERVFGYVNGTMNNMEVFIAEYSGELAGILILCDISRSVIWLSICVGENFRRKRIGTQLLRAAERYCMHSGIGGILLCVHPRNTAAENLYKREGYEKIGVSGNENLYIRIFDRQ